MTEEHSKFYDFIMRTFADMDWTSARAIENALAEYSGLDEGYFVECKEMKKDGEFDYFLITIELMESAKLWTFVVDGNVLFSVKDMDVESYATEKEVV
jgi:hypothetical protein